MFFMYFVGKSPSPTQVSEAGDHPPRERRDKTDSTMLIGGGEESDRWVLKMHFSF